MWEWIMKYWVEWVFGLIAAGVIFYVRKIAGQVQKNREKSEAMDGCMTFLMMQEMKRTYDRYEATGYCPMNEKLIYEKAYKAYHALGGNGPITELYKQVMQMPTNPPVSIGYQTNMRG